MLSEMESLYDENFLFSSYCILKCHLSGLKTLEDFAGSICENISVLDEVLLKNFSQGGQTPS